MMHVYVYYVALTPSMKMYVGTRAWLMVWFPLGLCELTQQRGLAGSWPTELLAITAVAASWQRCLSSRTWP
jgi:hypothetical protein